MDDNKTTRPKKDRSLPLAISDKIVNLISEQEYLPGDKIPSEFELAEQLNVSRGTVREAVKLLVSKNVLEIRRGKGTFVAEHPGVADDPWGIEFFPNKLRAAMQLLELRAIVEPKFVELAVQKASEEEISAICDACKATETAIRDGRLHYDNDLKFHLAIAKATHNELAVNMLKQLYNQSIGLHISLSQNKLLNETIETHAMIAEAICKRDAVTGSVGMLRHLEYNKAALEKLKETSAER